jgi:hypothetical protein
MPPPMYMWISWYVVGRQCTTLSIIRRGATAHITVSKTPPARAPFSGHLRTREKKKHSGIHCRRDEPLLRRNIERTLDAVRTPR